MSRLEDETTGEILPTEFQVEVPDERLRQAETTAAVMGQTVSEEFPFQPGAQAAADDIRQLLLNRTWRPQLEITGAAGLPSLDQAGNVLRPVTAAQVSLRIPPTLDSHTASAALKQLLEHDPPYGAQVSFTSEWSASGWNAPPLAPWLEEALNTASQEFFGKDACAIGEGGTIPFMAMLGEKFPNAQYMITGVLGPHSNAHGPNEFLEISMGKRLTSCVARVLTEHFKAMDT